MVNDKPIECEQFLAVADQFRLGLLMTELQHPLTKNLSMLSQKDLPAAIEACVEVDYLAFEKLKSQSKKLTPLFEEVTQALDDQRRIFLVGCGATGRLALCLEAWWRRRNPENNQVRGILAGGDLALIHSLEKAEDYQEFGARHLREANLKKDDLVIGITEGGETSYVIGAVKHARDFCERKPFIIYCNEDAILEMTTERSREFIQDQHIQNISLPIGPMALSGSTRMQASSVLQFVVGEALLGGKDFHQHLENLNSQQKSLKRKQFLRQFIEWESDVYRNNGYITYSCTADLGMTLLTDTTERSPTFGVHGLENQRETSMPALANVSILNSHGAKESFEMILGRPAHPLEWPEFNQRAGGKRLSGFDLSENNETRRSSQLSPHQTLNIQRKNNEYCFTSPKKSLLLESPFSPDSLLDLIDLKMLMNIHSTLVMGILARFESNVMTWVRPNNYKLIDRTIRYASMLLEQDKQSFSYEKMANVLFKIKSQITEHESAVERLAFELKNRK